jgi:hypothetical protein
VAVAAVVSASPAAGVMSAATPVVSSAQRVCQEAPAALEPSLEEVIAFGGISGVEAVRSSAHISSQPDADMSQMERAMRVAQLRNTPASPGTKQIPKFSILSFSDDEVVDRASRLGISMGNSVDEVLSSVWGIKNLEEARTLTIKKKSTRGFKQGRGSFLFNLKCVTFM